MTSWRRPLLRVSLVLLTGAAAVAAWAFLAGPDQQRALQASESAAPAPSAVAVEAARAVEAPAVTEIRSVGSLQSDESVWIASELAGRVAAIAFQEGQQVKAGDLLIQLDDTLERLTLEDAEARLELAQANFERTDTLAGSGSATQRARDEAQTELLRARAAVDLIRARLDKHRLVAPFDGTIGTRHISVGAFINPGTELVNLEKIDRLKVDFKVPELYFTQIKVGQSVTVSVDALPGQAFTAQVYTIDPMLDVNGRALQVRARLDNANLLLRPGLFARVAVKASDAATVVLVPEEAIVPRGQDHLVYRIEDGKAVATKVRLGTRRAGSVEIVEGLAAGAIVVTAGQQRLRDGVAVEVLTLDTDV